MESIKKSIARLFRAIGLYSFIQLLRGRAIIVPKSAAEPAAANGPEPEPEPYVHRPYVSKEMQLRKDIAEVVSSMEGLRQAAQAIHFTYFTDYDAQIATKQREFRAAMAHFDLDLSGLTVLDIGPGTADSLDAALDLGAKQTLFVEEEPFFVKFAQFKGHSGVMRNYTFEPFFEGISPGSIDLIYTKGSINCEWVNQQERLRLEGHIDHYFKFDVWLDEMKKLLKPGAGRIVLMPAMDMQNERIIDEAYDLDTYYWCPDVAAYRDSYFSQTLLSKGFRIEEGIEGFNQAQAFPLAFYFEES